MESYSVKSIMNTFLIMDDGRKNNGGNKNAGRKPKADEEKVNTLFANALKTFYSVETETEAKTKLVHTLMESQRGQIFVSEHLFGKPKETVDNNHNFNNFDIKDLFKFDNNDKG